MILHYIKIAWRNFKKHKLFTLINIFGLASGITVCMLAMMKIKEAYDFDNFHPDGDRTYRIITKLKRTNGEHFLCASSPLPLANFLKSTYNVIDKSTSVYFSSVALTGNEKKLPVKVAYVDTDFYSIFGFKVLTGAPAIKPQSLVLTQETAARFFGKDNPVGQVVTIGDSTSFIISGILSKPPTPSHLQFDVLASTATLPLINKSNPLKDWSNEAAAYTYVHLNQNISKVQLKNILKNASTQVNKLLTPAAGRSFVFDIQALNNISPGTKAMYNITAEPIMPNLIALSLIGFAMLLLAFFNYVNLTLAHSLDRAREVGVRKVAGALKQYLMWQFLSESVLFAILAFCLAYFQLRLVSTLPTVNRLIGNVTQDSRLWSYFILFTLITGLIAGWIPARVLSGFQPVRVLKGKFNTRLFGGVGLRKGLTVIQFTASLIAIVTLIVFYRQSTYMATADYGFRREHILNIQLHQNSYEKTANYFASIPGVERVSGTSALFGFSGGGTRFIKPDKVSDSLPATYFAVTPSIKDNMNLKIIAGENIPVTDPNKAVKHILINEEAFRELRFQKADDAIGKTIWLNDSTTYIISGVVKDFHYASFLRSIQPLILSNNTNEINVLNLQVSKSASQNIMPLLRKTWKQLYPSQPFEAEWFDKALYDQHLHKDDLVFLGVLTIMALSIACLGLLGMVIYTTKNRAKEVSIRRVMGAGLRNVVFEISKEFISLLLLAVSIGLPIGFMAGKQFLQQYVYRIPLGFGILAASAALLLLIGAITIGFQTYRTALVNPAKNLRVE